MIRTAGKVVLVLVTLVCLASMGGAMLFAAWVLVPLHWLAARDSGPYATGGWALLAGLSAYELGWMLTWIVTEHGLSLLAGAVVAVATVIVFVRAAADRAGVVAH